MVKNIDYTFRTRSGWFIKCDSGVTVVRVRSQVSRAAPCYSRPRVLAVRCGAQLLRADTFAFRHYLSPSFLFL